MQDNALKNYISNHYEAWLGYAAKYCRKVGLSLSPGDVLNDVILGVLVREPEELSATVANGTTGFHYPAHYSHKYHFSLL
ncbi:MAG: hypothetical protein LBH06_01765 [Rikenellaceae bacterium]|jgi:hypothetical protein|nr:hypothetical protein [Rikenellaceae bacterium]